MQSALLNSLREFYSTKQLLLAKIQVAKIATWGFVNYHQSKVDQFHFIPRAGSKYLRALLRAPCSQLFRASILIGGGYVINRGYPV